MDKDNLAHLNEILDREIELREKIKDPVSELEKKTRKIVGTLNRIHGTSLEALPALLSEAKEMLAECTPSMEALALLIPPNEYWRWHGMFVHTLQSAVFAAVLLEYLESEQLLSPAGVAEVLGVKEEWGDRLTIQAEDYLQGLITMVNELSRFAVNAVTLGDFERPIRISTFVKDLFAGFSMLNLKNDSLRRRFDSLKYDIKKIEEVVYDVSLRRLANGKNSQADSGAQPPDASMRD